LIVFRVAQSPINCFEKRAAKFISMFTFDPRAIAQPAHDSARNPFNLPATPAPLADLISDLRATARDLIDDIEEPRAAALALFRGTAHQLLPVCRNGKAWRGHSCAITRAELERAGFAEYAALFSFGRDPYRLLVGAQGTAPLGTARWLNGNWYEHESIDCFAPQYRTPRGEFFSRLADVLAARS
jgi:hypothetical protein